ncbi:dihydrofolate reductase family protein [Microbacterium sp.]|uniref:dihydrofolate reductase family protein n=1 Tax=Microbacterium sp. TaxID=51671 RepID=UPI001AC3F967|nr:dihydrofolate reductase family protein [Microbacterium sp.]MBN9180388.1 dihydrofolate reductase family protein [Microbacterium sp.]MBN9194407.1 dihydrofolate reductase family protein [Microbacterium sp.]
MGSTDDARVIVVQYITLDGVVEDPDGSGGTPFGGWAMRYGPEGVAGDKFQLGELMRTGVLLFGRRTWDHFATLWPPRETDFARAMNAADKAVVTTRPLPDGAWTNSRAVAGPLADWVRDADRTLVVIGSGTIVRALQEADLIDEYRLITFPAAVGDGRRLFPAGTMLDLDSSERTGPGSLTVHTTRR